MDGGYSRAVLTAFVMLYKRGHIYRGKRMVNWCPATLTALSDEEVIMKPQRGRLYKMRYELAEQPGKFLEISTTRPETLMGDTGVAVHPEDERYKHLAGQHVWRPFPKEKIPIVGDEMVDREFGTGVLKVTPAHDMADFEIGRRHGLPAIDTFNPDGTLNALAGEDFDGMDRFEARKLAVQKLKEMSLYAGEEPYEHNVGFSERADVPIEPRLSEQWFMRYPKIEEAKEAVRAGLIKFWPARWEKTYLHWLGNIRDWCISRQLWWGHRIPVWYRKGGDRSDSRNWHVSVDGPSDPENWERDEDVLDTWASSWLWPFATLGWPDPDAQQKADLGFFYPTSALVTGPDIIFFWVARMIIAGLEFMGQPVPDKTPEELEELNRPGNNAKKKMWLAELEKRIPFRDVYYTGIIRDIQGRKMSKSLGNSPEPLDLIERYGADGLRFGVMSIAPKGQDILFSDERVEGGRNFCNKLWNACRFRQMSGPAGDNTELKSILARVTPEQFDEYDHWILGRLLKTAAGVDRAFAAYEFNQMTQLIYGLFWGDFCDWYVEVSKTKLQNESARGNCLAVQDLVLRQVLLLLHPLTPHITDELWSLMGYAKPGELIQNTRLESAGEMERHLAGHGIQLDAEAVSRVDLLAEFVISARALKAEHNAASRRGLNFYYTAGGNNAWLIKSHAEALKRLIGAAVLENRDKVEDLPGSVTGLGTVYLDLASAVDVKAEKERLNKELAKLEKAIRSGESKLANGKFLSKAPPAVVEGARAQLKSRQAKQAELQRLIASLS